MQNQLIEDLMVVNIFQRCSAFAAEVGAVNLAQGVPEPMLDEAINKVLAASLGIGWQYTNPRGLDSLRLALAKEYGNQFTLDDVLVTSGCTESLYLSIFAASRLYGNKVAFFEPFYPYYTSLAKLLAMDAYPMPIKMDIMAPDLNRVEMVFKAGVKILILNTPHNPSGWVMNEEEAKQIRELADKYGVLLIVDEAYRYYTYTYTDVDANTAIEILYKDNQHIVLLGSASKMFSATGLRVGWMLGAKNILDIAYAVHLYTTYCHPAPLQSLVATLINDGVKPYFAHYSNKRDILSAALVDAGFKCSSVDGGHFILADYSDINNSLEAEDFARSYARKYKVMPLPANPFYIVPPKQVRFSFSVSMENIQQAVANLAMA